MEDDFELPVSYKGKELMFPARLKPFGYTFTLEVDLDDQKIHLERDEEKNWRILQPYGEAQVKLPERGLLEAIVEAVDAITR